MDSSWEELEVGKLTAVDGIGYRNTFTYFFVASVWYVRFGQPVLFHFICFDISPKSECGYFQDGQKQLHTQNRTIGEPWRSIHLSNVDMNFEIFNMHICSSAYVYMKEIKGLAGLH